MLLNEEDLTIRLKSCAVQIVKKITPGMQVLIVMEKDQRSGKIPFRYIWKAP